MKVSLGLLFCPKFCVMTYSGKKLSGSDEEKKERLLNSVSFLFIFCILLENPSAISIYGARYLNLYEDQFF